MSDHSRLHGSTFKGLWKTCKSRNAFRSHSRLHLLDTPVRPALFPEVAMPWAAIRDRTLAIATSRNTGLWRESRHALGGHSIAPMCVAGNRYGVEKSPCLKRPFAIARTSTAATSVHSESPCLKRPFAIALGARGGLFTEFTLQSRHALSGPSRSRPLRSPRPRSRTQVAMP